MDVCYTRSMRDFIILAGAPGSGKTTVGQLLQTRLRSPYIDFGDLRTFHLDPDWSNASDDEEGMSFDNLIFILKNYVTYGYHNVIVTDLRDNRIEQLPIVLAGYRFVIVTLVVSLDGELKKRVLAEERESGFRDVERALTWNDHVRSRTLCEGEQRIDNTHNDPRKTVEHILAYVEESAAT